MSSQADVLLAIENERADTITLRGREIPVTVGFAEQASLRFYTENPRIYSHLWKEGGAEPSQQDIFEILSKREHVREVLVPSIKANGGLIEPVLVRGSVVLEGNSRLAAYRLLAQTDAAKWRRIRVRQLPASTTDADIFSLLGEYHIVGKADWAPFEQAGYLYRRHKTHSVPQDQLAREIGLTVGKIRHLIEVYDFMIEVDDRNSNRWSYYDELCRGRKFDKAKQAFPDFVDVIVEKIKTGEIERAVDVRDRLPLIVRAGGNTLRRFVTGKLSFEKAVQDARERGAGDYNAKMLRDFRNWIAEEQLNAEFAKAGEKEKGALKYELEKIDRRVKKLLSLLS